MIGVRHNKQPGDLEDEEGAHVPVKNKFLFTMAYQKAKGLLLGQGSGIKNKK